MNKNQAYIIIQSAKGFAVHAKGCQGMGKQAKTAADVSYEDLDEVVADAKERGFQVHYCSCTK